MFSVILKINVPIISLYSIKWIVFTMDMGGVLCEVEKEVFFLIRRITVMKMLTFIRPGWVFKF
jgi:hypothetical protein